MGQIKYFVPGKTVEDGRFLAHYVQPMPVGVATAYLETCTSPGQIVLDPFCQSPALVTEVAATGRKVIAANSNPILALLVRAQQSLPEPRELDAATTRLGDSLKLGVPLREHLDGLYATNCSQCHRTTIADYFLWDRETGGPVEKEYRCQACGSEGRTPVELGERETLTWADWVRAIGCVAGWDARSSACPEIACPSTLSRTRTWTSTSWSTRRASARH